MPRLGYLHQFRFLHRELILLQACIQFHRLLQALQLELEDDITEIIENETLWENEYAEEEDEVAVVLSGAKAVSGNLTMVTGPPASTVIVN